MNNAKIHPNAICIAYGILYDVPLEIISFKWRQNYCRWRATKFGLALKLHYLWARRDRYRGTNVVKWGPRFFWGGGGLIWRTAPFWSPHLWRQARGFWAYSYPCSSRKEQYVYLKRIMQTCRNSCGPPSVKKSRGKASKGVLLHQDNASINTVKVAYWML